MPLQVGPDGVSVARLDRFRAVTAELAAAVDLPAVINAVVSHAAQALGAATATLFLLDGDGWLVLAGSRGVSAELMAPWTRFAVDEGVPLAEAVRTEEMVLVAGGAELRVRFPDLPPAAGPRSLVALPLIAAGDSLGVIGLSFPVRWEPDGREREYLALFADTCAQAIRRVQATAAATDRAAKLGMLFEASRELGSTLDYRATLNSVAQLAIRTFGDWCAVELLDDGVLRTVAVAHVDPARVELAHELQRRYPADPAAMTGSPNVVRTGVAELIPVITDAMLQAAARDVQHLRLARSLGLRSAMVVPLTSRERVLGAITIVSAESGRVYDQSDLAVAEDLGSRAGTAIDNAELHSQTQQVAAELQRAVLPDALPTVPGWSVAASYNPAGRTEVGGDFYDLLPQPGGRLAVVIGDVMGRGVAAAAHMAQVRAAVRAYTAIDPDPALVLGKLDSFFDRYARGQLTTLYYSLIDPATGCMQSANAGHLPPILLLPGVHATYLSAAVTPPLGTGAWLRPVTTATLTAGATLFLYTDGLIERRTEGIERGLQRLLTHASLLTGPDLAQSVAEVIAAVTDPHRDDDVTTLTLRRS